MTQNQIAYWSLQEEKRHNSAQEAENKRANLAKEHEANRTNVANENIKREQNAINSSHYFNVDSETRRANLAKENQLAKELEYKYAGLTHQYASLDNARIIAESQKQVGLAQVGATYASIAQRESESIRHESVVAQNNLANQQLNTQIAASNALMQGRENARKQGTWEREMSIFDQFGVSQAKADLTNTYARTNASNASARKQTTETKVVVPNAISNFVGSVSRVVGSLLLKKGVAK